MMAMLGAFAEIERTLIRERQREGIALAKVEGVYKGRTPSLTELQIGQMRTRVAAGERKAVVRDFGVSREAIMHTCGQTAEGAMAHVFECDGDTPMQPGDVDGMKDWMDELDAPTSTDWDLAVENPPHEGYTGCLPHPELAVTRYNRGVSPGRKVARSIWSRCIQLYSRSYAINIQPSSLYQHLPSRW